MAAQILERPVMARGLAKGTMIDEIDSKERLLSALLNPIFLAEIGQHHHHH